VNIYFEFSYYSLGVVRLSPSLQVRSRAWLLAVCF